METETSQFRSAARDHVRQAADPDRGDPKLEAAIALGMALADHGAARCLARAALTAAPAARQPLLEHAMVISENATRNFERMQELLEREAVGTGEPQDSEPTERPEAFRAGDAVFDRLAHRPVIESAYVARGLRAASDFLRTVEPGPDADVCAWALSMAGRLEDEAAKLSKATVRGRTRPE